MQWILASATETIVPSVTIFFHAQGNFFPTNVLHGTTNTVTHCSSLAHRSLRCPRCVNFKHRTCHCANTRCVDGALEAWRQPCRQRSLRTSDSRHGERMLAEQRIIFDMCGLEYTARPSRHLRDCRRSESMKRLLCRRMPCPGVGGRLDVGGNSVSTIGDIDTGFGDS